MFNYMRADAATCSLPTASGWVYPPTIDRTQMEHFTLDYRQNLLFLNCLKRQLIKLQGRGMFFSITYVEHMLGLRK